LVPPSILNFPTKDHWRSVARLSDITQGLEHVAAHYKDWGMESLAVPPLGCGEGQLDWRVVGPTLYRRLATLDIDVELYAPHDALDAELDPDFLSTGGELPAGHAPVRLPASAVALAAILRLVEREPYHWPVGRTTFQKLAYFASQAGIPTGLEYRRGTYGPFAEDLKRLETKLVNNGLIAESRLGRMFEVRTGPTYRDAVERYKAELEDWRPSIERVADLFLRSDTRRAEVLASAHLAATELSERSRHKGTPRPTERDVVDAVVRWKLRRRPPLEADEVASAVRGLSVLGWIEVDPTEDLLPEADLELAG
jgi:uncharacterized protein YwgA